MAKISINELKIGQAYTKPVYIDATNILVGANIPITESDLDRLRQWGVDSVETQGTLVLLDSQSGVISTEENKERIKSEYEHLVDGKDEFLRIYRNAHKDLKELFDALRFKKPFDNNKALKIVSHFIDILSEQKNSFLFISMEKEDENYLITHSLNLCIFSLVIGYNLHYPKIKLQDLGLGTLFMDVGMLLIPEGIRNKETPLTADERTILNSHTTQGFRLLTDHAKIKHNVASIARTHHENFDGSGYPDKLSGSRIEEYARIAAIVDHFDAQTRHRPYRQKKSFYESMKSLLTVEINKIDPILLKRFINRMSIYPMGSVVRLNNDLLGMVILSNDGKPMRPILKIVRDEFGEPCYEPRLINLIDRPELYIVSEIDQSELTFNLNDLI